MCGLRKILFSLPSSLSPRFLKMAPSANANVFSSLPAIFHSMLLLELSTTGLAFFGAFAVHGPGVLSRTS